MQLYFDTTWEDNCLINMFNTILIWLLLALFFILVELSIKKAHKQFKMWLENNSPYIYFYIYILKQYPPYSSIYSLTLWYFFYAHLFYIAVPRVYVIAYICMELIFILFLCSDYELSQRIKSRLFYSTVIIYSLVFINSPYLQAGGSPIYDFIRIIRQLCLNYFNFDLLIIDDFVWNYLHDNITMFSWINKNRVLTHLFNIIDKLFTDYLDINLLEVINLFKSQLYIFDPLLDLWKQFKESAIVEILRMTWESFKKSFFVESLERVWYKFTKYPLGQTIQMIIDWLRGKKDK